MEFRIADTFTDSLSRLDGQEQRAVKTTAFDMQLNPAHPGMQLHRIERARDANFWSVRVNRDLRLIVHRTAASLLLCYVDHHDAAYAWAVRRKIERHPRTGAAQLVEIRERVEEIPVYQPVAVERPTAAPLFADVGDDELLAYGVPSEWLADVRQADEDSLLDIAEHLPQEAAEALLQWATGSRPEVPAALAADADPFAHPDAQRRFRVLNNVAELEQALAYPWEKWTVFLHPAQRHLVERSYSGPARISGSAGTGKTIVALHRAVFLARQHPQAQILLATFTVALANALHRKLLRLVGNEPQVRERITVNAMQEYGSDLYTALFGKPEMVSEAQLRALLAEAAQSGDGGGQAFTPQFLLAEWREVVDAWQLDTWQDYETVPRLGRKTRIGGRQRQALWAIFAQVRAALAARNLLTWPMLYRRLAEHYRDHSPGPLAYAIVDESQDLSVAELRFLAALNGQEADSLFLTGDLGQRIFQQAFSWTALGVDIRGRSHTLRINYRTSHQIRRQADRLLPQSLADVDGNVESRQGTVSIFNGPPPTVEIFDDIEAEVQAVAQWIAERLAAGVQPEEIGVFVRTPHQLRRAQAVISAARAAAAILDDQVSPDVGAIAMGAMHLAKGLEFRAVAVMACDDEVIPLQARVEAITDMADLDEVYNTERHLLYVACTRAREHLLVTGVDPASEFLDDLTR